MSAIPWQILIFPASVAQSPPTLDHWGMDDAADRADISATLSGNGEAYRRIVQRHQQNLARQLRHFARGADLEELVQEVFVQAYLSLRGFSGKAPFSHWLSRIATRTGYAWLKKRKRNAFAQLDEKSLTAPPAAEGGENRELLEHLLSQLSARDRVVLTLLHLEERSIAETADLTGWSQTMVKVQAFRARGKLRKLLEKYHE
ncbi:MAG: RNA polymerase sigma factor [Tepidisphaeraceae bacterium]|jgi:RNA polymerase sigma-70 factor (ECF subfamily)